MPAAVGAVPTNGRLLPVCLRRRYCRGRAVTPAHARPDVPQALRERAGLQFALFVHGAEAALLIA
jgi:hypothetical protein